jgi:phage terminase small subunit
LTDSKPIIKKRAKKNTANLLPEEQKPLNQRQERFCYEYVSMEIPNRYAAYKAAGYAGRGEAGRIGASEVFNKPNVRKRIAELKKDRIDRLNIKADEVVRKLLILSSSNILDYMTFDTYGVSLTPSKELTREQAFAINEIQETVNAQGQRTVKFKLADKKGALQLLGQHFGLFDGAGGADNPADTAQKWRNHLNHVLVSVPIPRKEDEQSGGGK